MRTPITGHCFCVFFSFQTLQKLQMLMQHLLVTVSILYSAMFSSFTDVTQDAFHGQQ